MNTSIPRLAVMAAVASIAGCSNGPTEPKCDRCAEMRVITDRVEYRPGAVISFTVTNRTSAVLRYDWCSIVLSSSASSDEPPYDPARRCGTGAGLADVLAKMVLIEPGGSHRDSLNVGGATVQSKYQINLWLLDANGAPEPGNPVVSNVFDVFPGAERNVH